MLAPKKIPPTEKRRDNTNEVFKPRLRSKTNFFCKIKLTTIPVVALQKCAPTGGKMKSKIE